MSEKIASAIAGLMGSGPDLLQADPVDLQPAPDNYEEMGPEEQEFLSWWIDLMKNPPPDYKSKGTSAMEEFVPGTDVPQSWWDENKNQAYAKGREYGWENEQVDDLLDFSIQQLQLNGPEGDSVAQ